MTLYRRLQALERRAGIERASEAEHERQERDRRREAYLRTPAGAEMDRHLAGMARGFVRALSYEQHPEHYHDAEEHFNRQRFESGLCDAGEYCGALVGNPAKPWCSCGKSADEIGAEFERALEDAQRQADDWDARGRPEGG